MSSGRKSILAKILKIDEEIIEISSDKKYRKLKKNLRALENTRVRSRIIRIASPSDLEREIELRRNSPRLRKIIKEYRARVEEFRSRLAQLHRERSQLKRELFP